MFLNTNHDLEPSQALLFLFTFRYSVWQHLLSFSKGLLHFHNTFSCFLFFYGGTSLNISRLATERFLSRFQLLPTVLVQILIQTERHFHHHRDRYMQRHCNCKGENQTPIRSWTKRTTVEDFNADVSSDNYRKQLQEQHQCQLEIQLQVAFASVFATPTSP